MPNLKVDISDATLARIKIAYSNYLKFEKVPVTMDLFIEMLLDNGLDLSCFDEAK